MALPVPGPGRDTKYRTEYAEQARKLCLLGYVDAELATFFDVSETTINNWKLSHPAFLESMRAGKAVADAEVAESLYRRATGERVIIERAVKSADGNHQIVKLSQFVLGDVTAQRLWLLNRRKESWRDKMVAEVSGELGIRHIERTIVRPDN